MEFVRLATIPSVLVPFNKFYTNLVFLTHGGFFGISHVTNHFHLYETCNLRALLVLLKYLSMWRIQSIWILIKIIPSNETLNLILFKILSVNLFTLYPFPFRVRNIWQINVTKETYSPCRDGEVVKGANAQHSSTT